MSLSGVQIPEQLSLVGALGAPKTTLPKGWLFGLFFVSLRRAGLLRPEAFTGRLPAMAGQLIVPWQRDKKPRSSCGASLSRCEVTAWKVEELVLSADEG